MTTQHRTRTLAVATVAILLGVLAAGNAIPTHAATATLGAPTPPTPQGLGATGTGGVLDPVIPPATYAQLVDHARRIDGYKSALARNGISTNKAMLAQNAYSTNKVALARNAFTPNKTARAQNGIRPNGDPGNYGGTQGSSSVVAYAEPNTYAYRNYCGPASSQVVISNWTSSVPSIDTLASQEHTNPNPPNAGTLLSNMVGPINNDAGTGGFYINQVAGSQGAFSNWIGGDIYYSVAPLITAVETMGFGYTLKGWSLNAPHIVAIYGYNFVTPGAGTVSYVETSGTVAGTTGTGRNTYSYDPFWSLVTLNNGQIW